MASALPRHGGKESRTEGLRSGYDSIKINVVHISKKPPREVTIDRKRLLDLSAIVKQIAHLLDDNISRVAELLRTFKHALGKSHVADLLEQT